MIGFSSKLVEMFNDRSDTEGQETIESAPRVKASEMDSLMEATYENGIEEECDECAVKSGIIKALRNQLLKKRGEVKQLKAACHDAEKIADQSKDARDDTKEHATGYEIPVVNEDQEAKKAAERDLVIIEESLRRALADRDKAEVRAAAAEEALVQARSEINEYQQAEAATMKRKLSDGIQVTSPRALENWSANPLWAMMQRTRIGKRANIVINTSAKGEPSSSDVSEVAADIDTGEVHRAKTTEPAASDVSEVAADADTGEVHHAKSKPTASDVSGAANDVDVGEPYHASEIPTRPEAEIPTNSKEVIQVRIAQAATILSTENIWGMEETADSVAAALCQIIEVSLDYHTGGNWCIDVQR